MSFFHRSRCYNRTIIVSFCRPTSKCYFISYLAITTIRCSSIIWSFPYFNICCFTNFSIYIPINFDRFTIIFYTDFARFTSPTTPRIITMCNSNIFTGSFCGNFNCAIAFFIPARTDIIRGWFPRNAIFIISGNFP